MKERSPCRGINNTVRFNIENALKFDHRALRYEYKNPVFRQMWYARVIDTDGVESPLNKPHMLSSCANPYCARERWSAFSDRE